MDAMVDYLPSPGDKDFAFNSILNKRKIILKTFCRGNSSRLPDPLHFPRFLWNGF